MERQFGLPVAFAAAAHAALLFAFDKPPRAPAAKPAEKTTTIVWHLPPLEPEPPVEMEPSTEKSAAAPAPDVPLPGLPEPLVVDMTGGPTMTPPPLRPVSSTDITHILPRSFGTPGGEGEGWRKDITSGLDLDNPPRTRFQPAPLYPFEGKKDGMRGEVQVEFVVDESGLVRDPRVINSSHRMFEEPTLRAVAKWKFEPGRRHGRVVAFKMAIPVVFTLND